jgi:hypothetical protein
LAIVTVGLAFAVWAPAVAQVITGRTGAGQRQVASTRFMPAVRPATSTSPAVSPSSVSGPGTHNTTRLSLDELVNRTAGTPRPATAARWGGNVDAYWRAAESSRTGKTFEAVFAHSENARLAALNSETRVIVTAAEGMPTAKADLRVVDGAGKVVQEIQAKLGWQNAMKACSDPRYAGMQILTDADSMVILRRELAKAEAAAARRGIALAGQWHAVRESLRTGRLLQSTPTGAPLPTREAAAAAARRTLDARWRPLARQIEAAKPLTGRVTAPAVTAIVVKNSDRGIGLLNAIRSPGMVAGGATLVIDGTIAIYKFQAGQINKTQLADEITDATARAAAVGTAVQVVYILAATPHGLVVAGVAILTYVAVDALVTYARSTYGEKHVAVEDLRGIAPADFLDHLGPTLDRVGQPGSPGVWPVLSDLARTPLPWE